MKERARPGPPRRKSSKGDFKDTWGDLSALTEESSKGMSARFRSNPPSKQRTSPRIRGLRLLVVDDEPARLDAFAMELRELGAQVAVGDRGEAGYAQAVRLVPDVIISDLAKPGEPGWRLVQRLRRHPLLRWSPVLLLRWWQERQDKTISILVDRVVDRLEESIAPHQVISDRIASTKPVSERLDLIGPPALMRLLADSGAVGTLTLNDAWSVFEVGFTSGRVHSIVRRGLGGGVDFGADAFLQLMLCDSGRWTVRKKQTMTSPRNLDGDLDLNLERAAHVLGAVFGFDGPNELRRPERLKVDVEALAEAASTHSALAARVARGLTGKTPKDELEGLLEEDPDELGGLIMTFFRCGAVRLRLKKPGDSEVESQSGEAADGVSFLLDRLGETGSSRGEDKPEQLVSESVAPMPGPALRFGGTRTQKPQGRPAGLRRSDADPFAASSAAPDPVGPDSMVFPLQDVQAGIDTMDEPQPAYGNLSPRLEDARPTMPDEEPQSMGPPRVFRGGQGINRVSMWLAIGLSLFLGTVILVGLVIIASDGKGEDSAAAEAVESANGEPKELPPRKPLDEGNLDLTPADE